MAVRHVRFIVLVCGVMALQSACLHADEPPASHHDAVPSVAATPSIEESPVKLTPEQLEKKKKAYIGLAALAGIVIVGVSLGALTILWAGRLRRQLRKSDPKYAATERSFWFLKPPKPSITRSSLPELNRPLDYPPSPPPSEPQ
ncbi:MAG: hypothetical protein AABP62_07815 [Planctomycetota bacterium]